MLQVLDFGGVGRGLHGADDGDNLVGVVAAGDAAPERTPAFRRGQGDRSRRFAAARGRDACIAPASTAAARDEVAHPEGGLHQRAEARLHRRDHGARVARDQRRMRARAVFALVERARKLQQDAGGGARPRALLHAHEAMHPHIERRGAAKPQARRHVVAYRRGDEGAALPLVGHHPGHDDVVLEVGVHVQRPPDVQLDLVGDVHEAVAGVLVEHPVDLDLVSAGDDVAVVVRDADLGAVEFAGAFGAAFGILEHRLRTQLERMRPFHPFGRGEGPVARRRLGLGRIEHAEQRRPGREVGAEFAEVPGDRVDAQRVLAGVAAGMLVIVVVAKSIPEVDRERVVAG